MHRDQEIYRSITSPADLKPFVRRFLIADCAESVAFNVQVRPTGSNYLGVIFSGGVDARVDGRVMLAGEREKVHVSGQVRRARIDLQYSGPVRHVLAEFTCTGLFELLGIAGCDCYEQARRPDAFRPALAGEYDRLMTLGPDADSDVALQELIRFLRARIPETQAISRELLDGIARIEAQGGTARIGDVCAKSSISMRHFTRQFTRIVGITPKYYSRILQLGTCLHAMLEGDEPYLAGLALDAGFSDQAHFNNVFRDHLMASPLDFLESEHEMIFTFLDASRRASAETFRFR